MLLEAVVAAFVLTQLCYALVNCGLLGLFVRRPTNEVDERTLGRALETANRRRERRPIQARADGGSEPPPPLDRNAVAPALEHGSGPRCRLPATQLPRMHVLISVEHDQWDLLGETLKSLASQSYPVSLVRVIVAYDPRETAAPELEGEIGADRPPGLEVVTIETDRDALASDRSPDEWCFTGTGVSRAKAGALTHAYDTQSRTFADDDVVTVLEAGTRLPVDTFELAVAGLDEYDIVQAKRTVGNADDGVLPLLESMASAGWSDLCYKSSKGPYHLLGAGYFTEAHVLADLDRWQREADGDVPLGIAASRRGYDLGIIDRYARAHCPPTLEAWVDRKRQWTREPYRYLFARGWAGLEDSRFWTGLVLIQALALLSVVGVPAALLVGLLYSGGVDINSLTVPVLSLVGFNALVWSYSIVVAYRAAWDALPFRSRWHQAGYSIVVNPITQGLFLLVLAVPTALSIGDAARGRE
ncbi:glycosyltransferase [Natronorubrum texcoconense]|uniref:Glycosyltransferase, catalytic subunit of cellulose synthase and poly-beta-1,6-N-acetylglucosamine synthase n=1 Tax=Natronorubrum texcoconense TaxID=1095776 RepID=A0A1G8UIF0_9EURY|nr:glycosyltransferase family 2 protein [Natronorubrum texcoconense]SDJ53623.1 Glycosyltransferase, catalytic subunit of cellulose synthase and poly-beta-1,6-N-acetylglucosamine synthase [Natronorubrum texcoconense]